MPRSKETQPAYTEITFAVLSALTWQLLSWFGRFQHGRVPALLWVLVALCVAFSYSTAFNGRWLRVRSASTAVAAAAHSAYNLVLQFIPL